MNIRSGTAIAGAVTLATALICYFGVRDELVRGRQAAAARTPNVASFESEQDRTAQLCARRSGDGC